MLRSEATTADLTIAAATSADPLRSRAALGELLRREQAENERIVAGICHLLRYAGERDGKVPAPLLRRLVVGEGA
jgi:hypothetical protein